VLFSTLLLPGFLQMALFYFLSPRMLRSVPYGLQVRWLTDVKPHPAPLPSPLPSPPDGGGAHVA
jgi:prenylcysteine alpha-carboxyl methylesterase